VTSPPSSLSFAMMPTFAVPSRGLSYPSVPPPSLSSSFGSASVSVSPVEPLSRRGSITGAGAGAGALGGGVGVGGPTRRGRRSRAGSLNQGQLPETVAEGDSE